ncbi:MAG: RNase adapter RapZ [Bacteroidota bacterium]
MNQNSHIDNLTNLYIKVYGHSPENVVLMPRSGSSRVYYRIISNQKSCIGTFNDDVRENETFIYLSNHFGCKNIPVPRILGISVCKKYYLQTDLGTLSLYDIITDTGSDSLAIEGLIRNSITNLAKFNVLGFNGIDPAKLYPVSYFNAKSVMWDMYYFKYCFLKPSGITFDEAELEKVFDYLKEKVLSGDNQFLQFRDFQSRNIMISGQESYFIDFQGARIGSGLYDLASFLYQAKANFSDSLRQECLLHYTDEISKYRPIDRNALISLFPYMAIFRILQTLGAYGFRGLVERKAHFIQSIPLALQNLANLLMSLDDTRLSYLSHLQLELSQMFKVEHFNGFDGLSVQVYSFSIKNGYPPLNPEHGGGFVFDCRFLPNPGQLDEYKSYTGLDEPVINYLNSLDEVRIFCDKAFTLVKSAIDKYLSRNFKHLSVGFGCTGGQHRSVYCAEQLIKYLKSNYGSSNIQVLVKHIELEKR